MAPVPNSRVIFKEISEGYSIPSKTTVWDESQAMDPDTVPLNGGYLLKILVLTHDAYMRIRMRDPVGSITGVFCSEHPEVEEGDHLLGFYPFQRDVVLQEPKIIMDRPLEKVNKRLMPVDAYLGPFGLPGMLSSCQSRTGAVGSSRGTDPRGSVVVQLAKADGMKVIASAGSNEKAAWAAEIGADVVFKYKTTDVREVLQKEGPIDIYCDNVGGEQLEAAISTLYGMPHKYLEEFKSQYISRVASGEIKYRTWAAVVDALSGKNFGRAVVVDADE
ncbi:hypothetical protein C8T65DRAFT_711769 [Cerioporus squamosus]|nr:hypothetical protein C8T65DRAFT_711769 [Cerioporus squamosus]